MISQLDSLQCDIKKQLEVLDTAKVMGPDSILATVLKICAPEIDTPLPKLFQYSYNIGIYPTMWKIAPAHYSDNPRTEFKLSQHKDRNSVLRAIRAVQYRGGNTRTARGIGYVLKELFQTTAGMRQNVPHILVLLTDGQSQDDVELPARVAFGL
eukprot:g48288.t1